MCNQKGKKCQQEKESIRISNNIQKENHRTMIRISYLETIGNLDLHALILFTVYMAVQ